MPSYSTIEEKAAQWNISARHIQYLCRKRAIEGAVKRAGAWAIPDDAHSPAKNTKLGNKDFQFVGTKKKIFNSAIELSILKGFANVSYKDIAESVGVRQSTVYSHFKTKQIMLNTMYDFYCHHYPKERLSVKDMEPVIQKESLVVLLDYIRYEFKEEHRQKMLDITKIIFQRIGVDERAREIAKSLVVDEGIRYAESIFNHAVSIGRLAPFNTHILAVFINTVRIFTLNCWVLAQGSLPGNLAMLPEDEQKLYEYALKFLVELTPAAPNGHGTAQR